MDPFSYLKNFFGFLVGTVILYFLAEVIAGLFFGTALNSPLVDALVLGVPAVLAFFVTKAMDGE